MSGAIAAIVGTLFAGGLALSKNGQRKQPRAEQEPRMQIHGEEKPSNKHIYHSERYYDTWTDEFNRATKAHLKAQDPINENVVPLYYNVLGSKSELSPDLQSYIEKRGSRLKSFNERQQKKTMINEGGNEQNIDESPMFASFANVDKEFLKRNNIDSQFQGEQGMNGGDIKERFQSNLAAPSQFEEEMIEKFTVKDRKAPDAGGAGAGQTTKMEHFANFTVSGPRNSNNPNFHNNMVPFFGSNVKQNTDPEANQHLLERFTGQTNDVTELRAKPKREIPSLFDRTPGQTYIYGAPSDNVYKKDRYVTSNFKQDITPFEQIRVGPGISPGEYDWKGRDGFHPKYRPTFRNVDELRVNPKNVYEGRILPGQEQVQNRGVIGQVFKRRPDTFYMNDQRRWFTTTGAFTAQQVRENFKAYKQNREDTNVYYQGSASALPDNLGPYTGVYLEGTSGGGCGDENDSQEKDGIACGLSAQVKHTDRQQLRSTPYRNVGTSENVKSKKYLYDKAKPTTKQTTLVQGYKGQAHSEGNLKSQKYLYDKAKPTTKQTTLVQGYQGQAHNEGNLKSQKYLYDKAKATTKQTTLIQGYQGQMHSEGNLKNQKYYYDKARPTTKQTTLVQGYQGQMHSEGNIKNQKYFYDKARPTTKQTTLLQGYQGQMHSEGNLKNKKYLYDKARPTTKQTTLVEGYQGPVHNEGNLKQRKYLYDKARPTTKQTTLLQGYQGQVHSEGNLKQQKYLYDKARPTTKQTTLVQGYQGQAHNEGNLKQQKHFYDKAKTTTRQTTYVQNYQGVAGKSENMKNIKHPYDKAKTTTKQTTLVTNYQGVAGTGENAKATKYPYDKARTTTRQTTYVKNYQGIAGNGENTKPISYDSAMNATVNEDKEVLAVQGQRTYGPNKSTNITIGACDVNVQLKQKTGYDKTKYGLIGDKQYTATPGLANNFSNAMSQNQRSAPGIRQPEQYLVDGFNRNPYTQSLHSAPTRTTPYRRGEEPFVENNSEACNEVTWK
jgi:hypothetical protein